MANAQLLTCFDFSITIYCQTTLCLECADDSASSHSPISSFVSFNTPPVPTYPSIPILFLHTLLPFALHPLSLSHNFLPPFLLNSIFCLSSSNYLFLPHFFLASSLHPFLFLTLLKEKKNCACCYVRPRNSNSSSIPAQLNILMGLDCSTSSCLPSPAPLPHSPWCSL